VMNNSSTTYTTSDFITLTFELTSPPAANTSYAGIIPTSFSISDGVDTITNATAATTQFSWVTNSTGNFASWAIYVFTSPYVTPYLKIQTISSLDVGEFNATYLQFESLGENYSDAGVWTHATVTASATPEPSGLILLGTGMVGLCGVSRWRLRRGIALVD